MPETSVVAVFNGMMPRRLPDGVESVWCEKRIGQERGLWRYAFDRSLAEGWDWCAIVHDDFMLKEAGWESALPTDDTVPRMAVAGWCTYPIMQSNGICQNYRDEDKPDIGRLRVFADGCGIVFNINAFRARGCFTSLDHECGWGDLDACLWALSHGYGVWDLGQSSDHGGGVTRHLVDIQPPSRYSVMDMYGELFGYLTRRRMRVGSVTVSIPLPHRIESHVYLVVESPTTVSLVEEDYWNA